jgi:hypothetical protein
MHNLILGCDIDNAANFCTYENQRHIWPGARISGRAIKRRSSARRCSPPRELGSSATASRASSKLRMVLEFQYILSWLRPGLSTKGHYWKNLSWFEDEGVYYGANFVEVQWCGGEVNWVGGVNLAIRLPYFWKPVKCVYAHQVGRFGLEHVALSDSQERRDRYYCIPV